MAIESENSNRDNKRPYPYSIPENLLLGLEALSLGMINPGRELLREFSRECRETANFESYDVDALKYFIKNKPTKPAKTPRTPTELKEQLEETEREKIALEEICNLWHLDQRKPFLALKAYAFTGNEKGVARVCDKVEDVNVRAFTNESPLVDCLNQYQENTEIVELLMKRGAGNDSSALRTSLCKSSQHGHVKSLKTILKLSSKSVLDPSMLRDAASRAIISKQPQCYKAIAQHAETPWLESWFKQITQLYEDGKKDPVKPSYQEEYKILKNELGKRKIIEELEYKGYGKDSQALSI